MKWLRTGAALGTAAGAAAAAGAVRKRRTAPEEPSRWLAVTVLAEPDAVTSDPRFADAFAGFGDEVETMVSAAPGGRGTEIAARPRHPSGGAVARLAGNDPRQEVRRVLRDVKSVLETGEVIRTDPPTTGRKTPGGALVRLVTRRAGGEGRL